MSDTESILNQLKEEIAGIKSGPAISNVGEVIRVGDGVATIRGLSDVRYSEMLEFETEIDGSPVLGTAIGVDETGALLLRIDNGTMLAVTSASSLRERM